MIKKYDIISLNNHLYMVNIILMTGLMNIKRNNMKWFYIRFTYDHYCQGYEEEQETLMVQAIDFPNACRLIKLHYENAKDFKDLTIRETEHF